jgi:hypothetical protein
MMPNDKNLIDFSEENFLLIKVSRGANKEQLIEAITKALKESKEIPYFIKHREATKTGPLGNEHMAMFMRQEGW